MNIKLKNVIIIFVLFTNILYSQTQKDTVFIKNDKHQKIYIDNKQSKYYNYINNFNGFKSLNTSEIKKMGLNDKWIRVYPYKNKYILYAPCDWCNDTKILISNKEIQLKGCEIYSYKTISKKKINKNEYRIIIKNNENIIGYLKIKKIDLKNKIFEFYLNIDNTKQKIWMASSNDVMQYNILVNDCLMEKVGEYKFNK